MSGGIVLQGELFKGNCLDSKSLGDNCSGRSFIGGNSLWARSLGVNFPGRDFMEVIVRGAVVQGGIIQKQLSGG